MSFEGYSLNIANFEMIGIDILLNKITAHNKSYKYLFKHIHKFDRNIHANYNHCF